MYLSRFGVKNFKCLGDVDIPLTPIHVLIGENDAGKTSLLEAIAAFLSSGTRPLRDVFPEPWKDLELQRCPDRGPVSFAGFWSKLPKELNPRQSVEYRFTVEFEHYDHDCTCEDEELVVDEKRHEVPSTPVVHRTTALYWSTLPPKKREEPNLVSNDTEKALLKIRHFFRDVQVYRLDPRMLALPACLDLERPYRLDFDGFGLARVLDEIAANHEERFQRISATFCDLFPQFTAIIRPTQSALKRTCHSDGTYAVTRDTGRGLAFKTKSGAKVQAQQASDGAILFLGILTLIHSPATPRVLLLEEPENAIYPKRIEEFIQILRTYINRVAPEEAPQIIMTTHSPYLASFFTPEEITFMRRPADDPDGPVTAWPLRDAPNIHERLADGFYVGEVWYNLSEEEIFGEHQEQHRD